MSLHWPKPGISHVPSYQVSGIPFITRSIQEEVPYANHLDPEGTSIKVEFPFVTSWIQIKNISTVKKSSSGYDLTPVLMFGFSANGTANQRSAMDDLLYGTGTGGQYPAADHYVITFLHRIAITPGVKTPRMPIRCKEIYFSTQRSDVAPSEDSHAAFEIVAGLTNIPSEHFPVLSSSNGFKGVG